MKPSRFSLLFCLLFLSACQEVVTTQGDRNLIGPQIHFESTRFDFGEAASSNLVKHVYRFKNTGDAPLVLTSVKSSCVCLVADWPKQAIAPNEHGQIEALLNLSGKRGKMVKSITVKSNAAKNSTLQLIIEGNVVSAEQLE